MVRLRPQSCAALSGLPTVVLRAPSQALLSGLMARPLLRIRYGKFDGTSSRKLCRPAGPASRALPHLFPQVWFSFRISDFLQLTTDRPPASLLVLDHRPLTPDLRNLTSAFQVSAFSLQLFHFVCRSSRIRHPRLC
jgi:hypothetical protein